MSAIESATLLLGEREFVIPTAGFIRSKPWKKRLFEEIKPLFEKIGAAPDIVIDSAADLLKLVPLAEELFTDGLDLVFDMLISYSPLLEAEREYIENYATDKQILAAFQEVVILADPFGVVATMTRRLGRTATMTSSNSHAAIGAVP
jgi:hypothetical protein